MTKQMNEGLSCRVLAYGVWSESVESWDGLRELIANPSAEITPNRGPKPEIIPANERRRAPLPVRLAVESSWQATQDAGIDPKELTCVFVSGFGDTQLTDYMCKVLAGESKELSPTKFHNSVHNAAAGYWTISTGCEKAANSVAGFQDSVSLTLLEAIIQCQQEQKQILLTFFDAPVSAVLTDIMGPGSAFAFSMIIEPADSNEGSKSHEGIGQILQAEIEDTGVEWPVLMSQHEALQVAYANNPSARVLTLIEMLLGVGEKERCLPMGEQGALRLSV